MKRRLAADFGTRGRTPSLDVLNRHIAVVLVIVLRTTLVNPGNSESWSKSLLRYLEYLHICVRDYVGRLSIPSRIRCPVLVDFFFLPPLEVFDRIGLIRVAGIIVRATFGCGHVHGRSILHLQQIIIKTRLLIIIFCRV